MLFLALRCNKASYLVVDTKITVSSTLRIGVAYGEATLISFGRRIHVTASSML